MCKREAAQLAASFILAGPTNALGAVWTRRGLLDPTPTRGNEPAAHAGRRGGPKPVTDCYSVGLWRKVRRRKGDALPEFPLAQNAVVAVGHDHTHRPTDPRVNAVSIELKNPDRLPSADETTHVSSLAVIEK
jgi:hypothetical protein